MQEKLRQAAFRLAEAASELNILHLVLFGSAAEDTDQEGSDLDIFVVFDTEDKDISADEKAILGIVREIETEHHVAIDVLTSNRAYDDVEPYFLQKVFGSGVFLYSRAPQVDLNGVPMEPYAFVVFNLNGLSQSQKMKVRNRLYGYRTTRKRGKKKYTSSSRGLLDELEGKRLGKAAVLVPRKNLGAIKNFFDEFRVTYFDMDTWMFRSA